MLFRKMSWAVLCALSGLVAAPAWASAVLQCVPYARIVSGVAIRGDALTWWGIYLVAAETGTAAWTILSPIFLTWTLMKWSGAALLERGLKKSRPGYDDYIRRTSGFFPWPPKPR